MTRTLCLLAMLILVSNAFANKCVPVNGQKITPISSIQSAVTSLENDASPLVGKTVWVEAVVTLSKQGKMLANKQYDTQYKGYWLQEQKKDYDSNNQTSEGIFVFDSYNKVNAGDQVLIQAKVGEYYQVTQLQSVKKMIKCAVNQIIHPTKLTLPVNSLLQMESLEGMLVELNPLVISDFYGTGYGLQNYGQMVLSSKLQFVPTELKSTTLTQYQHDIESFKRDRIILDDGSFEMRPSYIPYPNHAGLSIDNPLVVGMNVASFVGIKHGYKQHNIIIPKTDVSFDEYKAQNIKAITGSDNIKIASINVKNYFNGEGEQKRFPTKRGAKNRQDFLIQQEKLISAMSQSNADIFGLIEIENDGFEKNSAIIELLAALNKTQTRQNQYTYIEAVKSTINSDAITQAFLYRVNKVKPQGVAKWIDLNHNKNDFQVRPALFQSFEVGGESLGLVLSHFKSRRGKCAEDKQLSKIEGNCHSVRLRSSQKITEFLKTIKGAIILLGDLNAYSNESPVLWFEKNGWINGKYTSMYKQEVPYSYSFNGLLGTLDHVLLNAEMTGKVLNIVDWHINSASPSLFDLKLGRTNNALRSSDHDLILIELHPN